jgi:hypothetical protein
MLMTIIQISKKVNIENRWVATTESNVIFCVRRFFTHVHTSGNLRAISVSALYINLYGCLKVALISFI